jgi:hypothetical protein
MHGKDTKQTMKRFAFLAGAVVFVCVAWTAGWFFIAIKAREAVDQLALADGEAAPRVTCDTLNVSGFPFRIDLACQGATVVSGDITAKMAELRASVLVYRPTHAILSGLAPVDVEDAFTGSRNRLDFAGLEGSVRLEGWRLARVSVVAEQPAWFDTSFEPRQQGEAERAEFHLVDQPEGHDAAAGTAVLRALTRVTRASMPVFGIDGGEAVIEADITGVPDDVRQLAEPDMVRQWQARDGEIALKQADGTAGVRSVSATGTLALDPAGRLQGQLRLGSRGIAELIGPMLPEQIRPLVLGAPNADGSYSQTLNARGGVVFAGFVPLTTVPPLF